MFATEKNQRGPFGLVVTGEADAWRPALEQIVGPRYLRTLHVHGGGELLEVVKAGLADAAVLDEAAPLEVDVLHLLRMIRRVNEILPVVIITRHTDRRWMESALRLAAFSVVAKPLALEDLLRQIHRIMCRLDDALRNRP